MANAASDEPYEPTPQNSSVLEVGTAKFNCLVLPEKALMEKLVGLYFRDFNCLYPYLHEPSFMKEFSRALQTGFVGVRRYWLGLLNMIMAISCRVSNGPEITIKAKFTNAEVFFNRSWSLCKDHFWNVSTFEGGKFYLQRWSYIPSNKSSACSSLDVSISTEHISAIEMLARSWSCSEDCCPAWPPFREYLGQYSTA